jgi:hypothetical protein
MKMEPKEQRAEELADKIIRNIYRHKVEEIVRMARIHLNSDRKDNKTWIYPNDLEFLLHAGAKPCKKNSLEADGNYTQEVIYDGLIFQTATPREIVYSDS